MDLGADLGSQFPDFLFLRVPFGHLLGLDSHPFLLCVFGHFLGSGLLTFGSQFLDFLFLRVPFGHLGGIYIISREAHDVAPL